MKQSIIGLALSLGSLTLAACVDDGYGYAGLPLSGVMYDGYYDNYYGPIYDGYWGGDGYFYYRQGSQDRQYHRGNHNHFRRPGVTPGQGFSPLQGQSRPEQGIRAPHYPRQNGQGGHQGGQDNHQGRNRGNP